MTTTRLIAVFIAVLSFSSCGDEATLTANSFTATLAENPEQGQVLGRVSVTTTEDDVTYSISNLNTAGSIDIDATTGQISVADASLFDFEVRDLIRANYTATAGDLSSTGDITINITDIDETVTGEPTRVLWTGPTRTFRKDDGQNETLAENQDRLTDNVWITRAVAEGQIYNVKSETAADKDVSPAGTEWAFGTIGNIDNLTFGTFRGALGNPKDLVGVDLVVHLIADGIYANVKFTAWSQGKNKGGFSYEISTAE